MNNPESISVILANHQKPLVGRQAAAAIVQAIASEYYGDELFRAEGVPLTEDLGTSWRVSWHNAVRRDVGDALALPILIMEIDKRDGRVIEISGAPR